MLVRSAVPHPPFISLSLFPLSFQNISAVARHHRRVSQRLVKNWRYKAFAVQNLTCSGGFALIFKFTVQPCYNIKEVCFLSHRRSSSHSPLPHQVSSSFILLDYCYSSAVTLWFKESVVQSPAFRSISVSLLSSCRFLFPQRRTIMSSLLQYDSALVCTECGVPITGQCLLSFGLPWHPSCLSCSVCGVTFDKETVFEGADGEPYCQRDYINAFAPTCVACNKPIWQRTGTLNASPVTNAINR